MNHYFTYESWQGVQLPEYFYGRVTKRELGTDSIIGDISFHGIGNAISKAPEVIMSTMNDALELLMLQFDKTNSRKLAGSNTIGARKNTLYYTQIENNEWNNIDNSTLDLITI